jgi:hypothetical protein
VRKINKLGRRAAALVLAVGLTLSTAAPVLAADADEVQTPAAQTEQQETDTEADEADVDTEADEAAALPELSEDREVAEEDEAVALPELSEDREVAEGDEAAADEAALLKGHKHKWKKEKTVAPTCTEQGYTLYKCEYNLFGIGCTATKKDDYVPALDHNMSDWIVVEATCTTAGEKYKVCQRSGCNHKVVEEGYAEAHPALDHDFEGAEWVIEAPTCTTPGQRYQVCKRDGCGQKNFDEAYSEAHPALGHAWGKYVNDNKPACEQQTGTAHCTREGCTATDTCNLPNLGSDGNPLPHKYTSYEYDTTKWENNKPVLYYKSKCDYCGHEDNTFTGKGGEIAADGVSGGLTDTALKNVKVNEKTVDAYVTGVINDALAQAQKKVQKAETKEQALAALDEISATVTKELQDLKISVAGSSGVPIEIDPEKLNSALKPLYSTIDELKNSLDDSFLSKDTIINVVDKLAGDVQGSDAPQAGIQKVLYNTVYGAIYKGIMGKDAADNNTQVVSDMVLQLVQEVVSNGDEKTWKKLTSSLVNDALDLAVDELMKDETYAKLLKTKLGKATLKEVEDEVRKQLVNDPEFMNQVRGIANKAASNAQKRVNGGWPTEKIMDGLQKDLLPGVTDLVSDQVNKLGASAGNIVDNKVSDTVHKFLPGKLGDWVSDKIGGKVNDAVMGKVDDLNKQVTDLISSTIKQLTCGKHEYGDFEILKNPTCTEKGQKGKVCSKCGKIKDQQPIPATGHIPVTDPAVAPTETSDGLTEGSHCSVCGAVLQAQEVIPMRDPTIDTWFSRAATTEADAKAAGFDSVDAANAALDAALTAAGFDPANAEHFTVQVNSSIGVLPNDRFSESGVTGKLTLPEGTRGKTAQTYYAVQMFTADTRFHKAGDVVVTPVSIDTYAKTGLQFTVYSEAVMAIAWKAQ